MESWLTVAGFVLILLVTVAVIFRGPLLKRRRKADDDRPGNDIYGFVLDTPGGDTYELARHRGDVLLLVNTASRCGFARQYAGLQALWKRYRDNGLVIIAVPSNDFLGQEPLDDNDIQISCQRDHGVTFPVLAKTHVRGSRAHPLFRWLATEGPLPGQLGWNFEKFLFDRRGHLRLRCSPRVTPDDPGLIAAVEDLLAIREG